jgi:pimeloyl-ACP methyl ester carboxylesterase
VPSPHLPPRLHKYENHASRYVTVDGAKIHYRDEGQGPALLLLHGVMASLHTWDGWVDALKGHYRMVRVDLPGFGFSDAMPNDDDYTPQAGVARIHRFADAIGLHRFHLAGNSLGGLLGMYYAATHPHRVDRMVLVSPVAYAQKLPPVIDIVSRAGIGEVAGVFSPRFIVERNVRMVYGDPAKPSDALIDRYYDLLQYGRNRRSMVKTFRALRAYSEDPTIAQRVPEVKAPTLLMWGDADRWVPPGLAERWKQDLPLGIVRVYPGLGHVAMEEQPEMTARDAHRFLSASPAELSGGSFLS